ncbi:MAG: outer membrane protein assembly factor BamA [Steroidobacteraceae bacterium]
MRHALVVSFVLLICSAAAAAQDVGGAAGAAESGASDFTVGDIHIEGLQTISEGTVFNYLPVNIGDRLTPARVREAIRALYQTGFFRDVQLRREGNTLIVVVLERPTIDSFEITGNKLIKTEDLQKSLRNVGLASGKKFDRSVLDDVTSYLTDQYFAHGKYAVSIDAKVDNEAGNRVKVKVTIKEGKTAKIREINIVGNRRFSDKEIRSTFTLRTPNLLSWYKQDDQYSRESLQGDLEKLRSYYMDRGYANFQIDSTQVQISPEKQDIYITIGIEEGQVYRIGAVKLAGTFVVPQAVLQQFVLVAPGEIFSRRLITATQTLIQNRLGQDGYAFAKVEPVPTANAATHRVALTFFIDPGNRVYVRNISFSGVSKINDVVLRRELRQLEGGWLSNAEIERSKLRIQRLPYVKKIDSTTTPVAGSPDQEDVDFKIEEGTGSQLSGGVGYSELYKLTLNGNFTTANFLGTGQRLSVDLEGGAYNKVYSVSHTNPYFTIDGGALTESISFSDQSQFISSSSQFQTKLLTAGLTWGYPLSEEMGVNFGLDLQDAQLVTVEGSSAIQAIQWVQENGHFYSGVGGTPVLNPLTETYVTNSFSIFGTKFWTPEILASWTYDSRNKTLFPDRGMIVSLSGTYTPPVDVVQYWRTNFNYMQFVPLFGKFTMDFNFQAGYGQPLGKTTSLPPFALYYGGGPDSVRGFYPGTLGPKDQYGNPYGGNMNVLGRAELIVPMPAKVEASARVKLFFDIGNVFFTGSGACSNAVTNPAVARCTQFYAPPVGFAEGQSVFGDIGPPARYNFSYNNLKKSVGLAVEWLAPMGLFRFSYALPLNPQRENDIPGQALTWGDDVERFQFDVGQAF